MLKTNSLILILSFLLISCAQQVAPDGGAKDEIAPKVAGVKPANGTINFSSRKIEIEFDEYVQIKDPSQIVISPPRSEKPSITAYGKKVLVDLGRIKLDSHTTYTINFGSAIADIHEAVQADNISYVLSTGDYIDSLSLNGRINSISTGEPVANAVVALYLTSTFKDSTILKKLPNYFTKTDKQGNYTINNLPSIPFRIIAFNDANNNLKWERDEPISFKIDSINPIDLANKKINLSLFQSQLYSKPSLLDSTSKQKNTYTFTVFGSNQITIKPNGKDKWFKIVESGKNGIDTIRFYSDKNADPKQEFLVSTPDTNFIATLTTKTKAKIPVFYLNTIVPRLSSDTLKIESTLPIQRFNLDRFNLFEDTLKIKPTQFLNEDFSIQILYPFKEGRSYKLELNDSALQSIYDQFNSSMNLTFTPKTEQELGNLIVDLVYTGKEKQVFQLIDLTKKVVVFEKVITKSEKINIKQLDPNKLSIQVYTDLNNNGKWDTGDYFKKLLAEPIFHVTEPIVLKAYWDIEQPLDLDKIINN